MTAAVDLETYKDALLVLGVAGVVVPAMHRLRVSPVLGFLLAGAILSPKGFGALAHFWPSIKWVTVTSPDRVGTLAEFGVVFLLFLIGLELSFERLLTMRRLVFGLGLAQVVISASMIALVAVACGVAPVSALVIGAALSLSSTAIVIEILAGQKRLSTAAGRTCFSILFFQDLAVVPILFLLGILDPSNSGSIAMGLFKALTQGAIALGGIVAIGRFLLQPLFRLVAQTRNHDMFIATTLFVAVGTSFATAAAGLSMALGAFVAGLLIAETEYRRAVASAIEPIKSILLGVFFFSVGLSLDFGVLLTHPVIILGTTAGLLILQALIVFLLARAFGISKAAAIESAALLAPGGEFAFIILTLALSYGLISGLLTGVLLTSVSLTMALIPACGALGRWLARKMKPAAERDPELAVLPSADRTVKALVVGYGRVGQLTCEMLEAHKIPYIAVDHAPNLVGGARREGKPIYYGDARNFEFLKKCSLDTAKAAIITISAQHDTDEIVIALRQAFPALTIIARAKDADHARHLYDLGVSDAVPETIEASLQLSEAALVGLGVPAGPVIASIHEKRDVFRAELQGAAKKAGRETRALPRRKGG